MKSSEQSRRGRLPKWLLAVIAVVACPCNLPVLLFLLTGTGVGAWLYQYQGTLALIMSIVFFGSLALFFSRRVSRKGKA